MTIQELVWDYNATSVSDDSTVTFVMMVNDEDYKKRERYRMDPRKSDTSVPVARVFNSFDVFKFEGGGREGIMARPTDERTQRCLWHYQRHGHC